MGYSAIDSDRVQDIGLLSALIHLNSLFGREKRMELAPSLVKEALAYLQTIHDLEKPQQLGRGPFYLARTDDRTVLAHGVVLHGGIEYKIGPIRQVMFR